MRSQGLTQWWAVGWNRFDFLIVMTSLAEVAMMRLAANVDLNPSIFRIFRICRVVRFVRVSEKAKGVRCLSTVLPLYFRCLSLTFR